VVKLRVPPLRERVTDIALLVNRFLEQEAVSRGRVIAGLTDGALSALVHYPWPGNVAELRDAVRAGLDASGGRAVRRRCLPGAVLAGGRLGARRGARPAVADLKEALREPERRYILRALQASHWNKKDAAERLRISRSTLYKKMKEHGLDRGSSAVLPRTFMPRVAAARMGRASGL
jgi:DNA-binding NtrC family response regulator